MRGRFSRPAEHDHQRVSHQLRALRTAKLIRSRKEGKNVYYSLNDAHVKDILEKALEHLCER